MSKYSDDHVRRMDEQFAEYGEERTVRQAKRRRERQRRIEAISQSHKGDGPAVSLEYGDVPSCSVCGADATADWFCHESQKDSPIKKNVSATNAREIAPQISADKRT